MNNRILLDPGHGWSERKQSYERPLMRRVDDDIVLNVGSFTEKQRVLKANEYREDFGTLAIATATKFFLERAGKKVYLTRKDQLNAASFLSKELGATRWQKRFWKSWQWIVKARKTFNCDTIVSIHTNAGGGSGIKAFYRKSGIVDRSPSELLSGDIYTEVHKASKLPTRGVERRRFALLKQAPQGCLIECGFHDSPDDIQILLDPEGLRLIGLGIARGILQNLS